MISWMLGELDEWEAFEEIWSAKYKALPQIPELCQMHRQNRQIKQSTAECSITAQQELILRDGALQFRDQAGSDDQQHVQNRLSLELNDFGGVLLVAAGQLPDPATGEYETKVDKYSRHLTRVAEWQRQSFECTKTWSCISDIAVRIGAEDGSACGGPAAQELAFNRVYTFWKRMFLLSTLHDVDVCRALLTFCKENGAAQKVDMEQLERFLGAQTLKPLQYWLQHESGDTVASKSMATVRRLAQQAIADRESGPAPVMEKEELYTLRCAACGSSCTAKSALDGTGTRREGSRWITMEFDQCKRCVMRTKIAARAKAGREKQQRGETPQLTSDEKKQIDATIADTWTFKREVSPSDSDLSEDRPSDSERSQRSESGAVRTTVNTHRRATRRR